MELTPANRDNQPNRYSNKNLQQEHFARLSDAERWGSLITGGAFVLMGLRKRSLRGALLALAGSGLAFHGASRQKSLKDTVTEAAGLDKTFKLKRRSLLWSNCCLFVNSPLHFLTKLRSNHR